MILGIQVFEIQGLQDKVWYKKSLKAEHSTSIKMVTYRETIL